jgi:hypothetical protein
MGIEHFIIVLGFNVLLAKDGFRRYANIYNGKLNKWLSVTAWLYAAWGIVNLVYAIITPK